MFDFADRYHVDLVAPPGVYLVGSELGWTVQRNGRIALGGTRADDNRLLGSAHLRAPRDGTAWREVVVRTHLYPQIAGVMTSTVAFGLLAAMALWISGVAMFDVAPWDWWDSTAAWSRSSRPHDRSAATAALLILPTIAQVLMFRYDEHSTVSVLIRRTRFIFVLTTLPLAGAAMLIAFPEQVDHPSRWWLAALSASVLGEFLLAAHLSRVLVVIGRERRRRPVLATESDSPAS